MDSVRNPKDADLIHTSPLDRYQGAFPHLYSVHRSNKLYISPSIKAFSFLKQNPSAFSIFSCTEIPAVSAEI